MVRVYGARWGIMAYFLLVRVANVQCFSPPLQALNLLNSPFVVEQTKLIAKRAQANSGGDLSGEIRQCFQLLLNRDPSADELAICSSVAREESLAIVCRALINSNEFVFLP